MLEANPSILNSKFHAASACAFSTGLKAGPTKIILSKTVYLELIHSILENEQLQLERLFYHSESGVVRPGVVSRSSITTSAIGSSIGSYVVADLPVLELLDGNSTSRGFLGGGWFHENMTH
ncbi:hypothetical protein Tco_1490528 [Tanacetum coccineum]